LVVIRENEIERNASDYGTYEGREKEMELEVLCLSNDTTNT